jgi:hypothetical protein
MKDRCFETYELVDEEYIVVVRTFSWLYRLEQDEVSEDDELNVNVAVRDDLMRRISSAMVRSSPSIVVHESNVSILE